MILPVVYTQPACLFRPIAVYTNMPAMVADK